MLFAAKLGFKVMVKNVISTLGMEATGDPAFSMFNLSLKDDWVNNKKFCHRLSDEENMDEEGKQEAQDRLGEQHNLPWEEPAQPSSCVFCVLDTAATK